MSKTWTNTTPTTGQKLSAGLVSEFKAAIDKLWGRRGASTTAGPGGKTITLYPVESSANYDINIVWNADPGTDVGHVWILPEEKLMGSFIVRNQGASDVPFTWTLTRQL